eukprot:11625593-Ditylum_brightwellii.AAC.1
MPNQEGTGSKTVRSKSTRFTGSQMYQDTNPPDLTIKNESAQEFLEMQDNDEGLIISPDKIDHCINDTTEGDDIYQPESSRDSTR